MSRESFNARPAQANRARRHGRFSRAAIGVAAGALVGGGAIAINTYIRSDDVAGVLKQHRKPNVEAPQAVADLAGQSDVFAFAYGKGLLVGCNFEEYMDAEGHNDTSSPPFVSLDEFSRKHLDAASQTDIDNGFGEGLKAGYDSANSQSHDIC